MTPDRNLAGYAALQTSKTIHAWDGYCPIHDRLTPEAVMTVRNAHPDAVFMAHPECRKAILEMADAILSTSGMIRFAKTSPHLSFIVGTELGLMHALQKTCPDKAFYPASAGMICPDMKKIQLEDVIKSLETLEGQVKVPEPVRVPALEAVRRMIEISGR